MRDLMDRQAYGLIVMVLLSEGEWAENLRLLWL
jgi:hypothetical protein